MEIERPVASNKMGNVAVIREAQGRHAVVMYSSIETLNTRLLYSLLSFTRSSFNTCTVCGHYEQHNAHTIAQHSPLLQQHSNLPSFHQDS